MPEHTAKKPLLLPCILLSSLLFTAFFPGSVRQGRPFGVQNPSSAPAKSPSKGHLDRPFISSQLRSFIERVANGNAKQVVGIYAPGEFAYPIVQQPKDQSVYVSSDPNQVTQFGLPSHFGSVALLAHNGLAGMDFFKLGLGSTFELVYGSGAVRRFQVSSIQKFQALDPENPYSNFVDTQSAGPELTSAQLFRQIYTHSGEVVIQTCIEEAGEPSWGRLFITAEPAPAQPEFPQTRMQLVAAL
jgi:hypothetical protein